MITRFIDITNSLVALGKEYTQVEKVRKVLRALTSDWEKKITAIEETNDLSTISSKNLIGNLMAYEVQLEERKKDEQKPLSKNKVLAFIHPQTWTIQMMMKRRWQCSQENSESS